MRPTIAVDGKGAFKLVFGYQGIQASESSLHELAENHSLFGLIKLAAVLLNRSPNSFGLPYYVVGVVFFLWISSKWLTSMPEVNQLLAATIFMLMLSPISYFYTLVHLYAPWLLLTFLSIRTERSGLKIPALTNTLFLFLPLFISFTLQKYVKVWILGGLVQAVALYGLFAYAVQYPFVESAGVRKPPPFTHSHQPAARPCQLAEVTRG